MKVTLLAHTQLSGEFLDLMEIAIGVSKVYKMQQAVTDGDIVALTAIRTCYSHRKPTEIVATEGDKYFGERGSEANRLFNHIVGSGHTSTLEHINFTFSVEGVSRALLAQLTRHRAGWSYSVQSQRYVKMSSDSRSGGFDYVTPDSVKTADGKCLVIGEDSVPMMSPLMSAQEVFEEVMMPNIQTMYDQLIEMGIPQEDARAVLPNATTTNLVVTCNLRALIDFVGKRDRSKGAQGEIAQLAEVMKQKVKTVEPRLAEFLEGTE